MSIEFLMNKEVWTCIHSLRSQIPIGSFEKLQVGVISRFSEPF